MGALQGRESSRARPEPAGRELALDLTGTEVVLNESDGRGGWRRFAGVALEDPEFFGVLELLRAEAEAALGDPGPVRIWLPPEQVLSLEARLGAGTPRARLDAAFARAGEHTGCPPEELAVAVGAPALSGESVVLVTYAATWHEARDYAARWGFEPGPVSTRHYAEAFGKGEPVFRVRDEAQAAPRAEPHAAAPLLLAPLLMALALAALPGSGLASPAPAEAPAPPVRVQTTVELAPDAMPGMVSGATNNAAPETAPETAPSLAAYAGAEPPGEIPPERPDRAWRPVAPTPRAEAAAAASGGLAAPVPPARPARFAPNGASGSAPASRSDSSAAPEAPAPVRAAAAGQGLPTDQAALVGVLELETGRKALLRLPDGEYRTVQVGDMLDGWKVSAISRDALRVSRGGEDRTLLLVSR